MYFHIFLQLENFSPSIGKFSERWRLHERCRQGTTRHPASFLPWNVILSRKHMHSWFLITLRQQQRIFLSAKSLTSEGAGQDKGWLDCTQASFWKPRPSCSDLHFTHHSFLLTICRDLPGFLLLQLLCCYELQRYMEEWHSLIRMLWSPKLKRDRQSNSCWWCPSQTVLPVINRDNKPKEEFRSTLVCYSVYSWITSDKNSSCKQSCPTLLVVKYQFTLTWYE